MSDDRWDECAGCGHERLHHGPPMNPWAKVRLVCDGDGLTYPSPCRCRQFVESAPLESK